MLETPRQAGLGTTLLTMPGTEMTRRVTAHRKHPTQLNCASSRKLAQTHGLAEGVGEGMRSAQDPHSLCAHLPAN